MKHFLFCSLICLLAGCSQPAKPYFDVFEARIRAQEKITKILSEVHDDKSMENARERFRRVHFRCEELKNRAIALGKPSPEILNRLQEQVFPRFEKSLKAMQAEIARIQNDVPGGKKFLQSIPDFIASSSKR